MTGPDAKAIEAVDLENFAGAHQVQVLALGRLPALRASHAHDLEIAVIVKNVVAGPHVAGESYLSLLGEGSPFGHLASLLAPTGTRQPARGSRLDV